MHPELGPLSDAAVEEARQEAAESREEAQATRAELEGFRTRIESLDAEPGLRADGEPFGSLPCSLAARPGAVWVAGARTTPPGRA